MKIKVGGHGNRTWGVMLWFSHRSWWAGRLEVGVFDLDGIRGQLLVENGIKGCGFLVSARLDYAKLGPTYLKLHEGDCWPNVRLHIHNHLQFSFFLKRINHKYNVYYIISCNGNYVKNIMWQQLCFKEEYLIKYY